MPGYHRPRTILALLTLALLLAVPAACAAPADDAAEAPAAQEGPGEPKGTIQGVIPGAPRGTKVTLMLWDAASDVCLEPPDPQVAMTGEEPGEADDHYTFTNVSEDNGYCVSAAQLPQPLPCDCIWEEPEEVCICE